MARRRISEVVGDYSMAGTRRMQAPGNIRVGYPIKGSHDSILDDARSEEETSEQADSALPQAAVVYATRDGKVLAVSRGTDASNLNMPGGGVEPGEDPKEAAARELWEETGLRAGILVPVFSKVDRGKHVSVFRAARLTGKLASSSEGKASWEKPEVLLHGKYGDFFREMLQDHYGGDVNEGRNLKEDLSVSLELLWEIRGSRM